MSDTANLFGDGQAYERMMGRWSQLAGATFLEWLAQPQGLRWLDVGCGNGAFTEVLMAKNAPAEVTGIDPSEGQLAHARTRPGTQRAQFRAAGAQDIPFGDDSFDAAVMPLVISFVPDPVKGSRRWRGWCGLAAASPRICGTSRAADSSGSRFMQQQAPWAFIFPFRPAACFATG